MIDLAALAKRITQTQRRLDYEAHVLAARVEKIDKEATVALRNAHMILDAQQLNVTAIEQMVQQLASVSAEQAGDATPLRAQLHEVASEAAPDEAAPPKDEVPALPFGPAEATADGKPDEISAIKNTIQNLADFQSSVAKRGNAA